MFKKLRKWYFKLYHLFRFLGVFILIFGIQKNVYAEDVKVYCSTSENKIVSNNFINGTYKPFETSPSNIGDVSSSYNGVITISGNTQYTFKFIKNPGNPTIQNIIIVYYDKSYNYIKYINKRTGYTTYYYTFTTPENAKYITLHIYNTYASKANSVVSVLYKGTWSYGNIKEPIIEYEQCKEETPEENEVYSNFMTLYIDKLNYLANGFTTNPYLLAMIGIIFAWVVLELFLKILHLKGGKIK